MSKLNKQPIRDFMQKHYTDARLAELLAHAQDGKLRYYSCCCFIGVATANHALRIDVEEAETEQGNHFAIAETLSGGYEAERAFRYIAATDEKRRRVLIPLIKAEMWRRAKLRKVTLASELTEPASQAAEHTEKELAVEAK